MKQSFLASAVIILAACSAGRGAPVVSQPPPELSRGSPEWIVEQYFVSRSFPDRRDFLFGELAQDANGPTVGAEVPAASVVTYRPVSMSGDAAVFAVTIRERDRVLDLYAFLESRGSEWRMGSIRGLALPPLYYMLLDSLKAKPALPDSEAADLANMELVTSSDSALRAYFTTHRAELVALVTAFIDADIALARANEWFRPVETPPELAARLRALSLNAISRDSENPGCIRVSIGGILDNDVGYLYAPAGCTPPAMSPHDVILLDGLDPGWYLYKTT